MRAHSDSQSHPEWSQLLIDAVNKPGTISAAYSRFWNYSIGNQLIALFECLSRKIEPGPINTFRGWQEVGRTVKRGERAITLCMPVTVKRPRARQGLLDPPVRVGDGAERQLTGPGGIVPDSDGLVAVTIFVFKPRWFVLCQTEGAEYVPTQLPAWSEAHALYALRIDRIPFKQLDGNCQGYASDRHVAISPIAALPHKTLFHELAHVVIGHTAEGERLVDEDLTPRNLREVEAESVALICCESLGLSGTIEARGYIQHWLANEKFPERSAQRIFKAADEILRAGREERDSQATP